MSQCTVALFKFRRFLFFFMKRTDNPHAGQIFSRFPKHLIESGLHLFIQRHRDHHNAKYDNGKQRNRHGKNKRRLCIDRKSHDHRTEYDKRRTQEQTQHHINTILHLIGIRGHARDHRRSSQRIHFGKG